MIADQPSWVTSADGVRLAVYDCGTPGVAGEAQTVIAVHGYPDDHRVFDRLTAELAPRFRVVRYDVRGHGRSDAPTGRASYRLPLLLGDLLAVLDSVSPDRPVHLVGHDWGSVQGWAAVSDARLASRIASFTSLSGPGLDQAAAWMRAARQHPVAAGRQLASSWYLFAFQLPWLPEAVLGCADRLAALRGSGRGGSAGAEPRYGTAALRNGLQLYRANVLPRVARPRPQRVTVPVQVIAPRSDRFVSVALQTGAPAPYVEDLTVHEVDGGHWLVAQRPELVAGYVADLARQYPIVPAADAN